jgi:hypothetical protein
MSYLLAIESQICSYTNLRPLMRTLNAIFTVKNRNTYFLRARDSSGYPATSSAPRTD